MDDRRKLELAGWALAAFVAVFLVTRLLHGGAPEPAPAVAVPTPHPQAKKAPSMLVVDVEGQVERPGLQRVPSGSRAGAAVDAAGGIAPHGDPTAVNLAAPLHDGQQIVVPKRGAPAAAAAAATPGASPGAPSAPISLSSATVAQLDTLDGIGPKLAQRIVQYRDSHGGFRSVDELKQVEGIGEKRFAALREALQP